MEDGEASGAQADASYATRPISEACSETVQEPESDSHPPDTSDREATELHPWPIERAPTTPKPGAGWRENAAHWAHRISLSAKVPPHACRDHLANERTFLGWVRTSIAFAILGTVIAQLFRLQHSPTPRPFGFYALGVPLASTCHGLALLMVLVGAQRYWTQQNAMVVGRIKVGGWGPWLVGGLVTVILLALFVLVIAVDVERDMTKDSQIVQLEHVTSVLRVRRADGHQRRPIL